MSNDLTEAVSIFALGVKMSLQLLWWVREIEGEKGTRGEKNTKKTPRASRRGRRACEVHNHGSQTQQRANSRCDCNLHMSNAVVRAFDGAWTVSNVA